MFYTNDLQNIAIQIVNDSVIYIIDDFFKNPGDIVDLIDSNEPRMHKWYEREITNYHNGTKFFDARHDIEGDPVLDLFKKLNILARQHVPKHGKIMSNLFQMLDIEYNNYRDHYWWPHFDYGFTGIIYLNEYRGVGTNIYQQIEPDISFDIPEHMHPWRPKSKYRVISEIECVYNRMVLFDGKKLQHGMAINDDTFSRTMRKNIVLFFEETPINLPVM